MTRLRRWGLVEGHVSLGMEFEVSKPKSGPVALSLSAARGSGQNPQLLLKNHVCLHTTILSARIMD